MIDFKQLYRDDIKDMLNRLVGKDGNKALVSSIYDKLDTFSTVDNYMIREHLKSEIANMESAEASKAVVSEDIKGEIVNTLVLTDKNGNKYSVKLGEDGKPEPNAGLEPVSESKIIVSAPDDPNAPADPNVQTQPAQQPVQPAQPAPEQQPAPTEPAPEQQPAEQPAEEPPVEEPATDETSDDDLEQKFNSTKGNVENLIDTINKHFDEIPDMDTTTYVITVQDKLEKDLKEIEEMGLDDPDYQTKLDQLNNFATSEETKVIDVINKSIPGEDINATPASDAESEINNQEVTSETPTSEGTADNFTFDDMEMPATESTIMSDAEDDVDDDGDMDDKIKTLRKDESDDAPTGEEIDQLFNDEFNFDDMGMDDFGDDNQDSDFDDIDLDNISDDDVLDDDMSNDDDEGFDIDKIEEAESKTKEVEDLMQKLFKLADPDKKDEAENLKDELEDKVEELNDVHEELKDHEESEEKNDNKEDKNKSPYTLGKNEDVDDIDIDLDNLDLDSLDEDDSDEDNKDKDEPVEEQLTTEQLTQNNLGIDTPTANKAVAGSEEFEDFSFDDFALDPEEPMDDGLEGLDDDYDAPSVKNPDVVNRLDNIEDALDDIVEALEEVTGEDLDHDNEEGEDEEHKKKVKHDENKDDESDDDEKDEDKSDDDDDEDEKKEKKKDTDESDDDDDDNDEKEDKANADKKDSKKDKDKSNKEKDKSDSDDYDDEDEEKSVNSSVSTGSNVGTGGFSAGSKQPGALAASKIKTPEKGKKYKKIPNSITVNHKRYKLEEVEDHFEIKVKDTENKKEVTKALKEKEIPSSLVKVVVEK